MWLDCLCVKGIDYVLVYVVWDVFSVDDCVVVY